jgi:phage baseplate assembly protein gpV
MKNFSQKIPLAVSLANFTEQSVQEGLSGLGQVYPCTVKSVGLDGAGNTVVTVNFEINPVSSTGTKITLPEVTMPISESKYVRLPVQVGDQGIAVAASVRIGGITGLGTGLAPLAPASNLGALVFLPVSNTAWTTLDPNAVVISASNGAIIRTDDGKAVVTIADDKITVAYQTINFVIDGSKVTINGNLQVNGTINSTGDISAGNVTMQTHTHQVVGVQGGLSTITTTVGAG